MNDWLDRHPEDYEDRESQQLGYKVNKFRMQVKKAKTI